MPNAIQTRIENNKKNWGDVEFKLWDEQLIILLLKEFYPTYLHWFVSIQNTISKCDIARAFILHKYGGLYADCDFDPNPQTISEFVTYTNKVLFIGAPTFGCNNFLIYSPPLADFWFKVYIPRVQESLQKQSVFDIFMYVFMSTWPILSTTGPVQIARLIKQYPNLVTKTPNTKEYYYGYHGKLTSKDINSTWYTYRTHVLQKIFALTLLFYPVLFYILLLII